MRRQRFSLSLPSLSTSFVPFDSESASVISAPYPEPVWNRIISPEPEAFFPCYIYEYPYYEISDEQATNVPYFFSPSITSTSATASHYNSDNCGFVSGSLYSNIPSGDGITPKDYALYDESSAQGNTEEFSVGLPTTYPIVTNYGAVTILLRNLVRIDVSPRKAVIVKNPSACIVAAISGSGNKSCIIHPNGKVLQEKADIHMTTLNRKAKITNRGIIFTSTDLCLSYLVDASGTKTTSEKYRSLDYDFSFEVFYDSQIQIDESECHKMVNESTYKSYWNGDEVWALGGFRIRQNQIGDVHITRNGERYVIRTSPTTGETTVKTLETEMTIGRYINNYFVVRKGDKKVTASLAEFSVQNGSQKAGINNFGKVALF